MTSAATATLLVSDLKSLLLDLHGNPCPNIPNPPNCKKRASVACIIRIRPTFPDVAQYSYLGPDNQGADHSKRLSAFFKQDWVQRGEPEILFIKRAAREGDRFTSHVAFPGGKRDLADEDDRATSIRETLEEVGLDLNRDHALSVGNLPERIVTAEWGKVPLMVLCPFVFLLTRYDIPPLQLQPTEVHSAHWVPLRALLSPSLRAWERSDLADRLSGQRSWPVRICLRFLLGQMLYAAIRLLPSESIYCSSAPGFIPPANPSSTTASLGQLLSTLTLSDHATSSDPNRPLLLWGLTYTMVEDFVNLLPKHDIEQAWRWPTFSAPDVRFVTWLISAKFRKEKASDVRPISRAPPCIIDEGLGAVESEQRQKPAKDEESELAAHIAKASAVGQMLQGYFQLVRRAVFMTLVARLGFGVALGIVIRKGILARRGA